ncbi:MAG: hypothetical protein HFH62_04645 [Lachnospiraceae bacterium]|nr:hypothetical protein [Lachnospiraceae bacterium]
MMFNLNGFKVIYKDKVLNAVALGRIEMPDEVAKENGTMVKAKSIEVLAIDGDGSIVSIFDEGRMFQFLPIIR